MPHPHARGRPIKALLFEVVVLGGGVMALLALFRFGFAVRFWRRVRTAAFFYVCAILVLAAVQIIFHVRL